MTGAVLTVQGNIVLNDQAQLTVTNGGLTFPQTSFGQYSVSLNNSANLSLNNSSFVTNGTFQNNFAMVTRADIIVTPRFAPLGCAANIVIDRDKLKQTGALTLAFAKDGVVQMRAARAADEDGPWSPAPKRRWGRGVPLKAAAKDGQNQDAGQEREPGEGVDASPLD